MFMVGFAYAPTPFTSRAPSKCRDQAAAGRTSRRELPGARQAGSSAVTPLQPSVSSQKATNPNPSGAINHGRLIFDSDAPELPASFSARFGDAIYNYSVRPRPHRLAAGTSRFLDHSAGQLVQFTVSTQRSVLQSVRQVASVPRRHREVGPIGYRRPRRRSRRCSGHRGASTN